MTSRDRGFQDRERIPAYFSFSISCICYDLHVLSLLTNIKQLQYIFYVSVVMACHNNNTVVFYLTRIIWSAGVLAAMGSITYPSISAFVSAHASDDQQGEYGERVMC